VKLPTRGKVTIKISETYVPFHIQQTLASLHELMQLTGTSKMVTDTLTIMMKAATKAIDSRTMSKRVVNKLHTRLQTISSDTKYTIKPG